MLTTLRQTITRRPEVALAAVAFLVGLVIFQGSVLSSDSSAELRLAKELAHGHLGHVWHTSRYPLEPSIILLPAAIAGIVAGHVAMGFVASLEYLLMGAALIYLGARWTKALRPEESIGDRGQVVLFASAVTLLWVYVTKEPMDVVIAALAVLACVSATQEDRLGWAGIALGVVACSRDQMVPVAVLGVIALLLGPARRRDVRGVLRGAFPVVIGLGIVAVVNNARYGSPARFGPGYDKVVHYGTSWSTIGSALFSIHGGILFFAPLCIVGIVVTWPRWRSPERPTSAVITVTLTIAIAASVLFIHPSASYNDIWSWGRSCRYFVPLVPITAFLIPRRPKGIERATTLVAAAVGVVWSLPMLLVAYDAQQRYYPLTSPDGPTVLRQYRLVPNVVHNSIHLIVRGRSPHHHSAFFVSLWQVESIRSIGRLSLVFSIPISVVAAVLAILIWREVSRANAHACGSAHIDIDIDIDIDADRTPGLPR